MSGMLDSILARLRGRSTLGIQDAEKDEWRTPRSRERYREEDEVISSPEPAKNDQSTDGEDAEVEWEKEAKKRATALTVGAEPPRGELMMLLDNLSLLCAPLDVHPGHVSALLISDDLPAGRGVVEWLLRTSQHEGDLLRMVAEGDTVDAYPFLWSEKPSCNRDLLQAGMDAIQEFNEFSDISLESMQQGLRHMRLMEDFMISSSEVRNTMESRSLGYVDSMSTTLRLVSMLPGSRHSKTVLTWLRACCADMPSINVLADLMDEDADFLNRAIAAVPGSDSGLLPVLFDRVSMLGRMWRRIAMAEVLPSEQAVGGSPYFPATLPPNTLSTCLGAMTLDMETVQEHTQTWMPVSLYSHDTNTWLGLRLRFPATQAASRDRTVDAQGRSVCMVNVAKGMDSKATEKYPCLAAPLPIMRVPSGDTVWQHMQAVSPWTPKANLRLARAAEVGSRTGRFRLPPILLVGKPGVGKTRWARVAAQSLSLPMHVVSLAGTNSSMSIKGNERGWKSARPSVAALAMQATACANPLLLLDEVDKAGTSEHNGNAIDALLPLLERETSCRYPDEYLLVPLDAGNISWVLTANSIDNMAPELLSRVTVIQIDAPGVEHLPIMVSAMRDTMRLEWEMDAEWMPDVDGVDLDMLASGYKAGDSIRSIERRLRALLEEKIWKPPSYTRH